jgi:transcriptional regulator with XRE-family HTH domain
MAKFVFNHHRIRSRRKARKATIEEIAAQTGLDAGNISKIERGIRKAPRADVVGKLAEALKVTPNYFYRETVP